MNNNSEFQLNRMAVALEGVVKLMKELNSTLSSLDENLDELNDKIDNINTTLEETYNAC